MKLTTYLKPCSEEEIRQYIKDANGHIDKLYLHWTAGRYDQVFDEDYHISIDREGRIYCPDGDLTLYKPHTWHRNTYACSITLNCCYGAVANNGYDADFGLFPPTEAQIEAMSLVCAMFLKHGGIGLADIMTHCEAAFEDGYGPGSGDPETRWDLWFLPDNAYLDNDGRPQMRGGGNVIRGKAIWYSQWTDV